MMASHRWERKGKKALESQHQRIGKHRLILSCRLFVIKRTLILGYRKLSMDTFTVSSALPKLLGKSPANCLSQYFWVGELIPKVNCLQHQCTQDSGSELPDEMTEQGHVKVRRGQRLSSVFEWPQLESKNFGFNSVGSYITGATEEPQNGFIDLYNQIWTWQCLIATSQLPNVSSNLQHVVRFHPADCTKSAKGVQRTSFLQQRLRLET